jgi:uncharacterized protein (TIGR03083 family)
VSVVGDDRARLWSYVETWKSGADDVLALLRSLGQGDWALPTDLPGWDVRAVAAHLAHLESDLAGIPQAQVRVPELAHVRNPMSGYTERGPLARADWPPERVVAELASSVATRYGELTADPPTDAHAAPPRTPGGIGWDWQTLLSNRCLDVWMHEQDVRRAVGRPGNLDTPGARHTMGVFAAALPYVVGKRVSPSAGTTVVWEVKGPVPGRFAVTMGEDGRARAVPPPDEQDALLAMDTETFVVLAGGRRAPGDVEVAVTGDERLAARVLDAMAVTP